MSPPQHETELMHPTGLDLQTGSRSEIWYAHDVGRPGHLFGRACIPPYPIGV